MKLSLSLLMAAAVAFPLGICAAEQHPKKRELSELFVVKEFGNKQCPLCRNEKEFDTDMSEQDRKAESALQADLKDADAKQRCLYCTQSIRPGHQNTLITWGECGHGAHIACVGKRAAEGIKGNINPIQVPLDNHDCSICLENFATRSAVIMPCSHSMCSKCYMENPGEDCPECRKKNTKKARYFKRPKKIQFPGFGDPQPQIDNRNAQNGVVAAPVSNQQVSQPKMVEQQPAALLELQLPAPRGEQRDAERKDAEAKLQNNAHQAQKHQNGAAAAGVVGQQGAPEERLADEDGYICSYCNTVITAAQIDRAKTSGLCDRFFWNRVGRDAEHYMHDHCVNAVVNEGYCRHCAVDNHQGGYEIRTLSSREEETLAKEIAAAKQRAVVDRRANAALMNQFRTGRETIERQVTQEVMQRKAHERRDADRKKAAENPARQPQAAQPQVQQPAMLVLAQRSPEEEMAARLGMSVQEFANMQGLTIDQLKAAIGRGEIR